MSIPSAPAAAVNPRLTAQQKLQSELAAERAKLRVEVALTLLAVVGFVVALVSLRFADPTQTGWPARLMGAGGAGGWLALVGYAVAYLAAGGPATRGAIRALRRGKLSIDMLMVLAAIAAALVGEVRDGAILLLLFSIAEMLEDYAMGNTKRAVASLMKLKPDTATLLVDGEQRIVDAEEVSVGALLLLKPGERVPLDGVVVAGSSSLDQSPITGESMPVDKTVGDELFAGSVNGYGSLQLRVTRDASRSTLARVIDLVTAAQAQKAPSQRFSQWFGQSYTRWVLIGSAAALAIFLVLGMPSSEALYKAATLLVVASPCAVVISVPAAILSALARSARMGVLFKGGAALEDFGAIGVVAMDKTGTLTSGRMQVVDVVGFGVAGHEVLRQAAVVESGSEHPLAQAIRTAAAGAGVLEKGPEASSTDDTGDGVGLEAVPGFGVTLVQNGVRWWAGNRKLAERLGAALSHEVESALGSLEQRGDTVVLLGRDHTDQPGSSEVIGLIGVADTVRDSSAASLAALRRSGVERFVMLTGDNRASAHAVAAQVGIASENVRADLLPEDKVAVIRELAENATVAFVGDGVNDAAALATATVGVAMGAAGSDIALEAADVALLSDDLVRLPQAHQLARSANRIIRQNLAFALGIMLLMVAITLFGDLPMPLAVLGHEGGTILVVLNGLRLLGFRPQQGTRVAAPVAVKEPALQG